jgi:predicted phage tail protein
MTTVVLTALAFIIPLGIYLALKPKKSSRRAQVRTALLLAVAALFLAASVNSYSKGVMFVVPLVSGITLVVGGVSIMLKNRRYTPM